MDSLSLSQQPAREDLSSITAMSEVLNTDILEFQPINVNHIAVHPECTALACELEFDKYHRTSTQKVHMSVQVRIEIFIVDTIFESHFVDKIVLKTMVQTICC